MDAIRHTNIIRRAVDSEEDEVDFEESRDRDKKDSEEDEVDFEEEVVEEVGVEKWYATSRS